MYLLQLDLIKVTTLNSSTKNENLERKDKTTQKYYSTKTF